MGQDRTGRRTEDSGQETGQRTQQGTEDTTGDRTRVHDKGQDRTRHDKTRTRQGTRSWQIMKLVPKKHTIVYHFASIMKSHVFVVLYPPAPLGATRLWSFSLSRW